MQVEKIHRKVSEDTLYKIIKYQGLEHEPWLINHKITIKSKKGQRYYVFYT